MFAPGGPSLRELWAQAMSSVERGYDDLAPKFDHTPFRTSARVVDAIAETLAQAGPFDTGLDMCCGTGAGLEVLERVCRHSTGVDFSAGMLAKARAAHPAATFVRADVRALPFTDAFDLVVTLGALGHFLPSERPALFAGVSDALRPGGLFALLIAGPSPLISVLHLAEVAFDLAMIARNSVVLPQFVMYYSLTWLPAVVRDLTAARFAVDVVPLTAAGRYRDGSPRCFLLLARKPGR